jgi:hypothetical protein
MNDKLSFDPDDTARAGGAVMRLANAAQTSVVGFTAALESLSACWGGDQYGAVFGSNYLPSASDAAVGVVERGNQLDQAAELLGYTASAQADVESDATARAAGLEQGT